MSDLIPVRIQCPYCWELQDTSVDPSVREAEYVEDCQICCQPIVFEVRVDDNLVPVVAVRPEND
jgi:hypothetical protein